MQICFSIQIELFYYFDNKPEVGKKNRDACYNIARRRTHIFMIEL